MSFADPFLVALEKARRLFEKPGDLARFTVLEILGTLVKEGGSILSQRNRDLVYRTRRSMNRIEAEASAERFDDFFACVRDARGLAAMLSKVEAQVRSAKTDAACSGFLNVLDETLFDPDILAHGMKIAGEDCENVGRILLPQNFEEIRAFIEKHRSGGREPILLIRNEGQDDLDNVSRILCAAGEVLLGCAWKKETPVPTIAREVCDEAIRLREILAREKDRADRLAAVVDTLDGAVVGTKTVEALKLLQKGDCSVRVERAEETAP